ncbi:hypothetical protein [Parvularcula dongshanensis]|uniref:DUF3667 domain-containing protein n=1 Tax=Parvularcula dongshanensis TaxID=1173995 RepID=A0A840I1N8_9PROT|nr:hypothetical protein [Parvularcula dongshanensis]MBB4658667.1 hypothetical protein [Parvularcula dongshanensis]
MDAGRRTLGADAMVEDVFGLNLRGLKTIRDMFVRPARVYAAARTQDWGGRYTPSIRLLFFILTAMAFFRFVWANEDGAFFKEFSAGFAKGAGAATETEMVDNLKTFLASYAASLPLAFVILHGLTSMVLRVWGHGTEAVLRLRLHLLTLVPSSIVSLLLLLAIPLVDPRFSAAYGLSTIGVSFFFDTLTAGRGGVAGKSGAERWSRAVLFGGVALFVSTAASVAAFLTGILISGFQEGFAAPQ